MDTKKLNYWLAVFLSRPGRSLENPILQLLCTALCQASFDTCELLIHRGVQTFLQETMPNLSLFRTPWTLCSGRNYGIGSEKKTAKPFSKEEEQQLWSSGALGVQDPVSLQRAVFSSNGKSFCLRGGNEHREPN